MSDTNLSGVFCLRRDITREMIERSINALISTIPKIKLSISRELLVDCILNAEEFYQTHDRIKYNGFFLLGDIKFAFINWEKGLPYHYVKKGRRQIYFNIWTEEGAYVQFLNKPKLARKMIEPLGIIASNLDAYFGFITHQLVFHSDNIENVTTNRYDMLFGVSSSFYCDINLAREIGIDYLKTLAIHQTIGQSGYFVSDDEIPFVTPMGRDTLERVKPAIIKRLSEEFSSL